MPERPLIFTVPELADTLRCSNRHDWGLLAAGEIGSVKIGALRRVTADQLDRYLASLAPESEPDRATA